MKKLPLYQCVALCVIGTLILFTPLSGYAQESPSQQKLVPRPREPEEPGGREINVEVWLNKQCGASYQQGEEVLINFRTSTDGYVTIYDIDTRSNVSVLFPNREQPDNFVRGNQVYTIPDRSYSYDLVVEGPEGIEYIDAVASTDPYYHWNANREDPSWLYSWGIKGGQQRDMGRSPREEYKDRPEYQNRPQALSQQGEESIMQNLQIFQNLHEQIRSKLIERPRTPSPDQPPQQENYDTATCYFYIASAGPGYPPAPQPTPTPYPGGGDYLRQAQRELEQIPGLNISRSGSRLIVEMPNTILFGYDSSSLQYQARQKLDQITDILLRYPQTTITVMGHTDSIGSASYNQRLSERRAQSVADYLRGRGVQPYRINSVGYGESRPIASNATEAGRQRNRRVELEIRAQ